jgi:hypothetical protein
LDMCPRFAVLYCAVLVEALRLGDPASKESYQNVSKYSQFQNRPQGIIQRNDCTVLSSPFLRRTVQWLQSVSQCLSSVIAPEPSTPFKQQPSLDTV